MSNKTWDDYEEVPRLSVSTWPACFVKGTFLRPVPYTNKNNCKHYDSVSDKSLLGVPFGRGTGEIIVKTLSRDECDRNVFKHLNEVLFKGSNVCSASPGSTLSWWTVSTQDDLAEQLRSSYKSILGRKHPNFKDLGTTNVFTDEFSLAYRYRTEQPKARFHCKLNRLLQSYKEGLRITGVELRVFGSTRYTKEVMHTVLICPEGSETLKDYPLIKVDAQEGNVTSNRPITKQKTDQTFVSIKKDEAGDYSIIWRPFCTRNIRNIRVPVYEQWDHLAFAFYLPTNLDTLKLPIPYDMQYRVDATKRDDHKFGSIVAVDEHFFGRFHMKGMCFS